MGRRRVSEFEVGTHVYKVFGSCQVVTLTCLRKGFPGEPIDTPAISSGTRRLKRISWVGARPVTEIASCNVRSSRCLSTVPSPFDLATSLLRPAAVRHYHLRMWESGDRHGRISR